MVSSTDDLLELIGDQISIPYHKHLGSQQQKSSSSAQYTPEKISKLLNITSDFAEQVEGQILLDIFGGKTLFSFDNHTIERLPKGKKFM